MKGTNIIKVNGYQVYSDRGHPGISARVETENGAVGVAMCTAGVSIGTHEIPFKYDGTEKFGGRGTSQAANLIDELIAPALIGKDAADQQTVDQVMLDIGKDILGGNATAAVSAANLKAGAASLGIPLYRHIGGTRAITLPVTPTGFLNGRRRYNEGPKTNKPTQCFVAYGFDTFEESAYALWELSQSWMKLMTKKFGTSDSPYGYVDLPYGAVDTDEEIWKMVTEHIANMDYEGRVGLQTDCASDSYYDHKTGIYEGLFNKDKRDRDAQIEFLLHMIKEYPFVILEDPLYEDDYEGTAILTSKCDIQIVGDDLFTTNTTRVETGIKAGAANTVLLKVNQIGSISESLDMIQLAYENNYGVMPCASRGEGIDICDYCVGINAGSLSGSGLGEYGNRFIEIERELGKRARFAGKGGLKGKRFNL